MYLYVVKDSGRPYYKIGVTGNVTSRLSAFNMANAIPLSLVTSIPLPYTPFGIEKSIHKIFHNSRLHGEWFKLSPSDLERIPYLVEQQIAEYKLAPIRIAAVLPPLCPDWRRGLNCTLHRLKDCTWCKIRP